MSRNTFDLNQINIIAEKLAKTPAPEKKLSKTDALRYLEHEIRKLQKKGHTMEDIAELLTESGIPTSRATLESALKKTGTGKKRTPDGRTTVTAATLPAPSANERRST
jgi:hypothetical protein